MADLTPFIGKGFTAPTERRVDPPHIQLSQAMIEAGITPPDDIYLDGAIHRFRSGTNGKGGGDKTGWYVAYGDGVPAGRFGCWRAQIEQTWQADVGRDITTAERMAHTRRMQDARIAREAEQKKSQEIAGDVVDRIWSEAGAASVDHPYLDRKGIDHHGARVTGDGRLIVPLYSDQGEMASLQYISADGAKRYHSGGAVAGKFWTIGACTDGPIYLAEGFATAATIHEVTGKQCYIAYSAGNLAAVAEIIRANHKGEVVIVADNDESQVGLTKASEAAAKIGARVVMPPNQGDANDYHQAGGDLAALLTPKHDDWLVSADEFCQKPAPISWLIKRWLQRDALIMVHGPSGGGKTFVVLDLCLTMASGGGNWCGHRASAANVVYLAGEGHHGLKGRIAAWKTKKNSAKLNMWLSRSGLDLNTSEGYQRTVEALRGLPEKPELIVVDTLHRFLNGDENSSQDAKTMLDACAALQSEFQASVLLVHHTGVSDESQHRARGSSAWRGALDIEISVVPSKEDKPMEVVQRKSKDDELAASIYGELMGVEIPGWIDEDGAQVTSAVFSQADAPEEKQKSHGLGGDIKLFERAWWKSGCEDRNRSPYVSRSAFLELLSSDGIKASSAANYIKPAYQNGPIHKLLNGGIIECFEHGWIMVSATDGAAMMMRKG